MSDSIHKNDVRSGERPASSSRASAVQTWKTSTWKNYLVAALGEFLGTMLFLFFAFAAIQGGKLAFDPNRADSDSTNPFSVTPTAFLLFYISAVFGVSLAVNVWIFYRVSGGIFNPAVTVGVMVLGGMPLLKGAILIMSQLLGGIVAAGLVEALLPGPLAVATGLGAGTSVAQGLFLEAFLTFELTLTIYMLAVEKHRATYLAPVGIGLALFAGELAGMLFTGGSLNPARSFGPAVVTGTFDSYHWIYWLGPVMGSVAASGFYKLLLVLEYTTANPGQDHDGLDYDFAVGSKLDGHHHDFDSRRCGKVAGSLPASRRDEEAGEGSSRMSGADMV